MKKILFFMVSFTGLNFSTSYSMDMFAYLQDVVKKQKDYSGIVNLQQKVDETMSMLNSSNDQNKLAAYESYVVACEALFNAQVAQARENLRKVQEKMFERVTPQENAAQ